MTKAIYKDTLTIKLTPDGWVAKMHGFPFYWEAATAQECLQNAGKAIDEMQKQIALMKEAMSKGDEADDE